MTKQRTIRLVPGSLALILAVTAYILGSVPFTPALALLLLALPLALLSAFMDAWRLALLTLYFATAIGFIVFFAGFLSIRLDYLLALLGVIGIALGGALFYFHQQTSPVN